MHFLGRRDDGGQSYARNSGRDRNSRGRGRGRGRGRSRVRRNLPRRQNRRETRSRSRSTDRTSVDSGAEFYPQDRQPSRGNFRRPRSLSAQHQRGRDQVRDHGRGQGRDSGRDQARDRGRDRYVLPRSGSNQSPDRPDQNQHPYDRIKSDDEDMNEESPPIFGSDALTPRDDDSKILSDDSDKADALKKPKDVKIPTNVIKFGRPFNHPPGGFGCLHPQTMNAPTWPAEWHGKMWNAHHLVDISRRNLLALLRHLDIPSQRCFTLSLIHI